MPIRGGWAFSVSPNESGLDVHWENQNRRKRNRRNPVLFGVYVLGAVEVKEKSRPKKISVIDRKKMTYVETTD
jgi:hypothetical protein